MAAPLLPEPPPPPLRWRPALIAWAAFWLLMIATAVQREATFGTRPLWQPVLWEGSSGLVTTLMVLAGRPWLRRADGLLHEPRRWFAAMLLPLPVLAPLFVAIVYALRHAVYAALGRTYLHEAWGPLFVQESLRFALFYGLFCAAVFGWRSHAQLAAARLEAQRAQTLQQQAQLLQLTQQIEPHFLFNALNTIAATVHDDAERADALITRLAMLLRAATDLARRPVSTLDEELALLEAYAALMGERFGPRVQLAWPVDPAARAARLPTMLLQPLLENAFRHGVERVGGPVRIEVGAERRGDRLRLWVADDAGRLGDDAADGVGLGNLRQRLTALHGAAASLQVAPNPGGGVRATVELPWC